MQYVTHHFVGPFSMCVLLCVSQAARFACEHLGGLRPAGVGADGSVRAWRLGRDEPDRSFDERAGVGGARQLAAETAGLERELSFSAARR